MLLYLLVILSSLNLVLAEEDLSCNHSKKLLPGVDILLTAFNIQESPAAIGNSGAGTRIFKIPKPTGQDWNSSCPYFIPDDYLIGEEFSCHMVPETHHIGIPSDIFADFQSLCPVFDKMLGIESEEFKWTVNEICKENRYVYKSKAICSMYSVSLRGPYRMETFPKFEDWYAMQVYSLPDELNATTIRIFEAFLNLYGDHVITKCHRMGGILGQLTSVNKNFVAKHGGHSEVKEMVTNMFFKDTFKPSLRIDKDFYKAARVLPIRNVGGEYGTGIDGAVQWVESIKTMRKNLMCIEWDSVPVTHFYDLDERTKSK